MKWQYRVEGECSEGQLNELGELGWELVSINGGRYTFRRPKSEPNPPRGGSGVPTPREFFGEKTKTKR